MSASAQKNLYESDFHAWTLEQKDLLHKKQFTKLDLVHLEEELQLMGASERRELLHRLKILLCHLLKWKYQPALQGKSWVRTIKGQREDVNYLLRENPSLNPKVPEFLNDAYRRAILLAADETGIDEEKFPLECEWTVKQILDNDFFPN